MKNQRIENGFKSAGIKEAAKRLNYLKLSEQERLEYDIYRKHMASIEYKYETYFENGIEKGIKQGMEKGKKKRNMEIALKLKSMEMPTQQIMECTGLSKDDIEKL